MFILHVSSFQPIVTHITKIEEDKTDNTNCTTLDNTGMVANSYRLDKRSMLSTTKISRNIELGTQTRGIKHYMQLMSQISASDLTELLFGLPVC